MLDEPSHHDRARPPRKTTHKWKFAPRFRRHAFGWRSQPAIARVKEAVSEIRAAARTDPILAAEGAVLFLEKVSAALEHVDSSSGSIGNAVNRAIEALVPVIASAPADAGTRAAWLDRLFEAHANDSIPYIESLGQHWGALCASRELASEWADRLVPVLRLAWSPDPAMRGFFHGTTMCLSALHRAERYAEILELLEMTRLKMWPYHKWGVRALAAMGKKADALRYAESAHHPNDYASTQVARECEAILLSSGLRDEAYARYGVLANAGTSHLATFRALVKKYDHKDPAEILRDLCARPPGEEGRWFAAAKEAGLYDEAIALAQASPCDPRTLTRAARDFAERRPDFATEAGLAAIRWLLAGHGYEIEVADVWAACRETFRAAEHAGRGDDARVRARTLVEEALARDGASSVAGLVARELERRGEGT